MRRPKEENILKIAQKIRQLRVNDSTSETAARLEEELVAGLLSRGASERTLKYVLELADSNTVLQ
jgi:hypothetical protein